MDAHEQHLHACASSLVSGLITDAFYEMTADFIDYADLDLGEDSDESDVIFHTCEPPLMVCEDKAGEVWGTKTSLTAEALQAVEAQNLRTCSLSVIANLSEPVIMADVMDDDPFKPESPVSTYACSVMEDDAESDDYEDVRSLLSDDSTLTDEDIKEAETSHVLHLAIMSAKAAVTAGLQHLAEVQAK